ncbi:hypothetical protein [Streptomyces sp. NPDC056401]|uniref:hypothetical protein n=1 Tax=Streptomyces sp. NPDC056401 TaxID=3345809 RepID=UPI0035DFE9DF
MNGNPVYHAISLAAATLFVLPFPVAILAGWIPPKLPSRAAALPYAWALLCFYVLAPINAVPRMLDASATVVMACTAGGLVPTAAAVVFLVRATWLSPPSVSKTEG